MLNAIQYALGVIDWEIPEEILDIAFLSGYQHLNVSSISRSHRILEKVISQKVLVDCSLFGGRETSIPIDQFEKTIIDPTTTILTVAKNKTQNSSIVRALSLSYLNTAYNYAGTTRGISTAHLGTPMMDATAGILNAAAGPNLMSTATLSLVEENTVLVTGQIQWLPNLALRCWLEHDTNLSHLQTTSYGQFAKLVEFAVKAYIYKTLNTKMDRAFIFAGVELGEIKNIIQGYSDAHENYKDYLVNVWQEVMAFNSPETKQRHLRSLTSAFR